MKRIIYYIIAIIACFLLQCSLFEHLEIASITPNLLIILTASIGFMRGKKEGLIVGFFCGLMLDILSSNVVGFYALMYMIAGYINGFFTEKFYQEHIKLPVFSIAITDICCNLVIYIGFFVLKKHFEFGYYLLRVMLPELVYTMVVAIVLYYVLLKTNQYLETIERRSNSRGV